jgi:hypothetical protein
MDSEEKSFKELVKEAPMEPTLSVVGALAQSSEEGKFVLRLQDGRSITLETSSVKGYTVLGTSVGHTIVRIEVDAGRCRPFLLVNQGRLQVTTPLRAPITLWRGWTTARSRNWNPPNRLW